MIKLFKDVEMTKELAKLTCYPGEQDKRTFITPAGVWGICVDDLKETGYALEMGRASLSVSPPPGSSVKIIPENSVNLKIKNSALIKEYEKVLYVHTPTPQEQHLYLKLEHDYSSSLTTSLKLFGVSFTLCVNTFSTEEGPHPLHIKLAIPASEDIRLYSDLQLCAIRVENKTSATLLSMNETGGLNFDFLTPGATQKRKAILHVV